jgi:hypothetical protein
MMLKEIVDAVWDATHHGIGRDVRPFIQPTDIFVSPVLPSGRNTSPEVQD